MTWEEGYRFRIIQNGLGVILQIESVGGISGIFTQTVGEAFDLLFKHVERARGLRSRKQDWSPREARPGDFA